MQDIIDIEQVMELSNFESTRQGGISPDDLQWSFLDLLQLDV